MLVAVVAEILEGLAATGIAGLVTWGYRRYFGQQIEITHPRPNEALTDREPLGSVYAYPVRGTLKRLPKSHEIWLLRQDETTEQVWPQGFFNVKYDHEQKTWFGKICYGGKKNIRIVAVVAPPTSQDFFRYYQQVGESRQYIFEPLKRIPAECRNQTSVQARFP